MPPDFNAGYPATGLHSAFEELLTVPDEWRLQQILRGIDVGVGIECNKDDGHDGGIPPFEAEKQKKKQMVTRLLQ